MRNKQAILLGMLCVLFVSFISLGQAELSDAEIIKEINASERRTRDHVDKKVEELGNRFNELDKNVAVANEGVNKEMKGISTRIDDLQGKINLILNLIIGGMIAIFVSLVLSVVGYLTKPLWEKKLPWYSRAEEDSNDANSQEERKDTDKSSSDVLPDTI